MTSKIPPRPPGPVKPGTGPVKPRGPVVDPVRPRGPRGVGPNDAPIRPKGVKGGPRPMMKNGGSVKGKKGR